MRVSDGHAYVFIKPACLLFLRCIKKNIVFSLPDNKDHSHVPEPRKEINADVAVNSLSSAWEFSFTMGYLVLKTISKISSSRGHLSFLYFSVVFSMPNAFITFDLVGVHLLTIMPAR